MRFLLFTFFGLTFSSPAFAVYTYCYNFNNGYNKCEGSVRLVEDKDLIGINQGIAAGVADRKKIRKDLKLYTDNKVTELQNRLPLYVKASLNDEEVQNYLLSDEFLEVLTDKIVQKLQSEKEESHD